MAVWEESAEWEAGANHRYMSPVFVFWVCVSLSYHVAAPLHRNCPTNYFNPLPHQRLVGPAMEAAKPAHSRMFFRFYDPCSLVFKPQSGRRLAPLSSGATKSSSSKTIMAINGVPGSMNAVELSRSKLPGATQISWGRTPVWTAPIYWLWSLHPFI